MRQWGRSRLAELQRRGRRLLADWRRRDPKPWVVALLGMALGLGILLFQLALVGVLRFVAYVVKAFR